MRDYNLLNQDIRHEMQQRRELMRYSTQSEDGSCDLCRKDAHLTDGLCPECDVKCAVKGERM